MRRPASTLPRCFRRRWVRWIAAGGAALLAVALFVPVLPAAAPTDAPAPRLALELRRGDRVIPPGGADVAPPTPAAGPRERRFAYTITNRSKAPVRLAPLAVRRALNCAVTVAADPAQAELAAGEALNLTVVVTPRDRGPWRAVVALPFRAAPASSATTELAWTLAAAGP